MAKCPYCDYETPEPDDGNPGVRAWQEVAHMNLNHPDIIRERLEKSGLGRIPLTTLRARIDYGTTEAKIAQGHIGIKVWINQGDYLEDDANASNAQTGQVSKKPARQGPRRGQQGQ